MRSKPTARGFGFGSGMASVAEPSPQSFNWVKERANLSRDSNTRTSSKYKIRYVNITKNMRVAWYEKQGTAGDVLIVGEMEDLQPRGGEVRIHVAFSGVNPGDVKKRQNAVAVGMPYPRVIAHSDGSGTVDAVGDGISRDAIGGPTGIAMLQPFPPHLLIASP
jgi:hypothetical protein